MEDTRQAVLEARRAGLIPFCVTIDRQAGDYLPHLFGRHGYTVAHDARRLPQVLTRLYAGLTGQGNRMNGYQLKSAEQLMTIFMK